MEVADFPKIIEIELTNRCNKTCSMCQRQYKQPSHRRDLQMALVEKILEQILGQTVQLNLGGLGESMLVEELPELLRRIKHINPGVKTGVNTNGLNLTEDKWEWLTDGRLDYFTISIDAPDKEAYQWLVGDDTYDLICANAQKFFRYKGIGKAPFTTVHCFELPKFHGKFDNFKNIWADYADHVQIRSLGNWGGVVPTEKFGVALATQGVCERPWVSLAIDTNGAYHRCCASFLIDQPAFNIDQMSIYDYWNGEQMENLRNSMIKNDFSSDNFCSKCSAKSLRPNTLIERQWQDMKKDA